MNLLFAFLLPFRFENIILQSPLKPTPCAICDFFRLGFAIARVERRQHWLHLPQHKGATLCDVNSVFHRFRQILEQLRHLFCGFEIVLRCRFAAISILHIGSFGNTQQRIVRLVHFRIGEKAIVRSNNRNIICVGQVQQRILYRHFFNHAVTLQFHIQPIAENLLKFQKRFFGLTRTVLAKHSPNSTFRATS